MEACIALLIAVSAIYIFFECFFRGIEGEFLLFKKCNDCGKLKLRWLMGKRVNRGYYYTEYEYVCKKCVEKEKIQEEIARRKKNEYKREDELIDTLYSDNEER